MKNSTALRAGVKGETKGGGNKPQQTTQISDLRPLMMKDTGLSEVFWSRLEGWPHKAA